MRKKFKYGIWVSFISVLVIYLIFCMVFQFPQERESDTTDECSVYYAVNTDGMKGLGHSILVLVDEEGNGTVLSFNGMQRNLPEALMGQTGVGKMSIGLMDVEEMEMFLRTGDLDLEGDQLKDNYDLALYRNINCNEYDAILEEAEIYIETGNDYEELYAKYASATGEEKAMYKQQLEEMGSDKTLPLYQIYTNNCDRVARKLLSRVDEEVALYNEETLRMTPNGNIKGLANYTDNWGCIKMGELSMNEKILEFFAIF